MIRGAIEIASKSIVAGWLFSPLISMRGKVVLAFIDDRHIGIGKVEHFRKDLKDAGLGDGFAGFHFPVKLSVEDDAARITIRLESSDLYLLQLGAQVQAKQIATLRSERPPSG